MTMRLTALVFSCLIGSATLATGDGKATQTSDRTMHVNDQLTFAPGYAIGDTSIAAPRVADFKILPGRRGLVLYGKSAGVTRLTIWDQTRVKRDEIVIQVIDGSTDRVMQELQRALTPFPEVSVGHLGGALIVTGTANKADRPLVSRIAAAAKAQDLVKYTEADRERPGPPASHEAILPSRPTIVQFEVTLLEASTRFSSGKYDKGPEPSGPVLTRCVVPVTPGERQTLFLGDRAADATTPTSPAVPSRCRGGEDVARSAGESGIRLVLDPGVLSGRGTFPLRLLVETNLPVTGQHADPDVWRRSRLQLTATLGEPLGITGADLLAAPTSPSGLSTVDRVRDGASTAASVPGVNRVPGIRYGSVFGRLLNSPSFKKRKTQLLLLLTARQLDEGEGSVSGGAPPR